MAASKEKRIADIVDMMERGMETADILRKLAENCGKSKRSFEYEITAAKTILHDRNKLKEDIRQAQVSEALKEAVNEAIISDLEIEAILCNIIKGNMSVEQIIGDDVVLRNTTPGEIINAAKTIYAKRGSNAPTKVAQTNKDGEDITPAILDDTGVDKVLKLLQQK